MTKKRINTITVLILLISLGYALLSRELNINGQYRVSKSDWNIYWSNIDIKYNSVTPNSIEITDNTEINFSVTLNEPGDFFEFTVEAINDGNIDAMIETITKTELTQEQQKLYNYSVKYISGLDIEKNDYLKSFEKRIYVVKIEYKYDINIEDLLDTSQVINLNFEIGYKKADENAKDNKIVDYFGGFEYNISGNNKGLIELGITKTNIKRIERSNTIDVPKSQIVEIVSNRSYYEMKKVMYIWYKESTSTLYYYTEADKLFLNQYSFSDYTNLEYIDLKTIIIEDGTEMFKNDSKLNDLDLRYSEIYKIKSMKDMFYNCTSLNNLILPNKRFNKLTNGYEMKNREDGYNENVKGAFCNCPAYNLIDKSLFSQELHTEMTKC